MFSFFAALSTTVITILLIERQAQPRSLRPVFHRFSLLSMLPPVVFFATMFMISYRPFFAGLATIVTFVGIVVVNNAKVAFLREPLVFSDFALLRQAIRYPALYIKYVGVGKVVMVAVAGAAAIIGAVVIEAPVITRRSPEEYVPLALYLATIVGLIYAITRGPLRSVFSDLLRRFGPTANVAQDMDKLSLVVCLIFYFFLSNEPERKQSLTSRAARRARTARRRPMVDAPRADVVVIQSESFFDARRLAPSIPRDILACYDTCAREACYRGRLTVPAWGANTMRTEFAFLSGLPNEALGYHRFNPYLSLCKQPIWTVAHLFRSLGYRTICIHPFHATFFNRETVIPNLGFDRFLDLDAFGGAATFGPYVSDRALADKVCELLDDDDERPAFIFAITMENHGKWEKGRLDREKPDPSIGDTPLGSFELGLYLRHLRNTDAMVDRVSAHLKHRTQDAVFCVFGDHLPPLPGLFRTLNYIDPQTDYFIWRKGGSPAREFATSADVLGRLVLDAAMNGANHEFAASTVLAGE